MGGAVRLPRQPSAISLTFYLSLLFSRMKMSVTVSNGINELEGAFAGRTVADVRSMLQTPLNIGADARAVIGRRTVGPNRVLRHGDKLEFIKPGGVKGLYGRPTNVPRERGEYPVNRGSISRPPVHPGAFFERNILPEFLGQRRAIGEIARMLGVSRQTLHRVLAGRSSVTPDMAVRLGKLCGNGPDLWLSLQARYDTWEATQRLRQELKSIPTLRG
jgi:addiction module HigA family antidote